MLEIFQLATLQPLLVKIHVVLHWKAPFSGCLKIGGLGHVSIFRVCHTLLKIAILIYKMAKELKQMLDEVR